MPYLKGEDINIGIAKETTRGMYVTPAYYIPGRTPHGVKVAVEKTPIRETTGNGVASTGSIVVQKRAEGDLEFNVRSKTIGLLLLSLFGKVTDSTLVTGVYSHLFEILTGNPQYPTLSLVNSQLGLQDYKYVKAAVKSLEIRTPVNDLVNATATFLATDEQTVADVTVAFDSTDYYFRHYDVTIKIASAVGGLGAASPLLVKEFSLSIDNNARVNQNVSQLNPGDVLSILHEITGSLKLDYQDETIHDAYVAGTYYAMSITMARTDVDIDAGAGTQNPTVTFVMPKVSFEKNDPDRPIDDITMLNIDYMAHFDSVLGYAIQATVINNIAAY